MSTQEPLYPNATEGSDLRTAADVIAALRRRYPSDQYAFLEQVANGTGVHRSRSADAVVMSLWPSRGLEITGIEVKVSRSDWQHELQQPEKADAIARYCDRWYVATGSKEIVTVDELPKGWGLLVPDKKGEMKVKREATIQDVAPLDRIFLAALLRNVAKNVSDSVALSDARQKGWEAGYNAAGGWEGQSWKAMRKHGGTARQALSGLLNDVKDYVERIEQAARRIPEGTTDAPEPKR